MNKESMKTGKSQSDKFKETAKEHGCDESDKAFADKLKKIVKGQTEKK